MSMLRIDDIHVYYGAIHAIKGVSFEVNEGEIVALIGANGAGKSTILKTVSGLMHPRQGTITSPRLNELNGTCRDFSSYRKDLTVRPFTDSLTATTASADFLPFVVTAPS